MDRYDRQIIRVLEQEGRISWAKLGERVSLSASAAQRRVERMQRDGVISQFTLRLSDAAVGNTVKAFVSVSVERDDSARSEALRRFLVEHDHVQSVHMVSGSIDLMLEVIAKDVEDLGRFLEDELLCLPGVRDATSSIVLKVVKPHRAVLGSSVG